ncbi:MAG TPA: hypothetical protein V6C69_19085 [Trichormus sp.]|jgi:hypothetical protein
MMFGNFLKGLLGSLSQSKKRSNCYGSVKKRCAYRQIGPQTVPVGVNWLAELDYEHQPLHSFVNYSVRNIAVERFFSRNLSPADGTCSVENAPALSEEEEIKSRVLALLDRLRDGLECTIVGAEGGKQWYVPAPQRATESVLADAVGDYSLHTAEDPNTPVHLLEKFVLSDDSEIRIAVADNPNTPVTLLSILAHDENPDVRFALAENHNIGTGVLSILVDDDNPYVADRARRTLDRLAASVVVEGKFDKPWYTSRLSRSIAGV